MSRLKKIRVYADNEINRMDELLKDADVIDHCFK